MVCKLTFQTMVRAFDNIGLHYYWPRITIMLAPPLQGLTPQVLSQASATEYALVIKQVGIEVSVALSIYIHFDHIWGCIYLLELEAQRFTFTPGSDHSSLELLEQLEKSRSVPEYEGLLMPDGSSNTGTMTSDFVTMVQVAVQKLTEMSICTVASDTLLLLTSTGANDLHLGWLASPRWFRSSQQHLPWNFTSRKDAAGDVNYTNTLRWYKSNLRISNHHFLPPQHGQTQTMLMSLHDGAMVKYYCRRDSDFPNSNVWLQQNGNDAYMSEIEVNYLGKYYEWDTYVHRPKKYCTNISGIYTRVLLHVLPLSHRMLNNWWNPGLCPNGRWIERNNYTSCVAFTCRAITSHISHLASNTYWYSTCRANVKTNICTLVSSTYSCKRGW